MKSPRGPAYASRLPPGDQAEVGMSSEVAIMTPPDAADARARIAELLARRAARRVDENGDADV